MIPLPSYSCRQAQTRQCSKCCSVSYDRAVTRAEVWDRTFLSDYFFIKKFAVRKVYPNGVLHVVVDFLLGKSLSQNGALISWSTGVCRGLWIIPFLSVFSPSHTWFQQPVSSPLRFDRHAVSCPYLKCQFRTFWLTDTQESTMVKVLNPILSAGFLLSSVALSLALQVTTTCVLPVTID